MVTPSARIDAIRRNGRYAAALERIKEREREREFCRHDLEHFLDVARIMSIMNVEFGVNCPADEIYAAALLHDLGRSGGDGGHARSSADMAREILPLCGFCKEETERIAGAILAHGGAAELCGMPDRTEEEQKKYFDTENPLGALLAAADKLSRRCFDCLAQSKCYWEKKNERIWI